LSWRQVRAWRDTLRHQLDALPRTMLHPKTLRAGVEISLDALSDAALDNLDGRRVRPYESATLVLARTVPTASIEWAAVLLGWGTRVTMKPPSTTPHLAHWLVEAAEQVGLPLSVNSDRGALAQSSVVIAMGRDDTVRQIEAPLPTTTSYLGLGDRFSAAWVEHPDQWKLLAEDIALHDSRGCMSPSVVFTPLPLKDACQTLQTALDGVAVRWPKGELQPFEGAAIRSRRQLASATTGVALRSDFGEVHGLVWPQSRASLPRCVAVFHAASTEEMARHVRPFEAQLSTLGVPSHRQPFFRDAFDSARVCETGEMQRPPLHRMHDGLDWIAHTHR